MIHNNSTYLLSFFSTYFTIGTVNEQLSIVLLYIVFIVKQRCLSEKIMQIMQFLNGNGLSEQTTIHNKVVIIVDSSYSRGLSLITKKEKLCN